MRISTMQMHMTGIESLLDQQNTVSKTQLQLSTGKAILTPSDDPSGAARILNLQRAIGELERYESGTTTAVDRLNLEDQSLSSLCDQIYRLKELSIQGANGTQSNESREAIAAEVKEALEYIMRVGNTRSGDEYLFAGFMSNTEPFTMDNNGNVVYGGDQGERELQIGPNRRIQISDSGYEVFMNIKSGNGTFDTQADATNTGTGVVTVGSVTDPGSWAIDNYEVNFVTNSNGDLEYYVVEDTDGTPTQLAPSPNLRAAADADNQSSATVALDFTGADESNANYYTPVSIEFTAANTYNIINSDTGAVIEAGLAYTSGNNVFSGVFDPGYDLVITDGGSAPTAPQTGDVFTAERNSTSFTEGQAITEIPGITFNVTGAPADGDSFDINASSNHSIFDTVKELYDLLSEPTTDDADQALFDTKMGKIMKELDLNLDNINRIRAGVGARLNAVDTEINANEGAALELRESLSSTEDLDYAEAISRFNLQLMSLQAAQSSFSKIQQLSLFNYLG